MSIGKGIGGHHHPYCGMKDDWVTPPEIIKALGEFDLDPCSIKNHPWPIGKINYFPPEKDGLIEPWVNRVFLNPPYGPQTGLWLKRLADHGNGIALTYARTETRMFFNYVWNRADAIMFLEGRLFFYTPEGIRAKHNSGGPSCLIAYGKRNVEALYLSGLKGYICKLKDSKGLEKGVLQKISWFGV